MRAFACDVCGQLLFFENSLCLRCGAALGFVPSELRLAVVGDRAARCANLGIAACNWIVEEDGIPAHPALCASCRMTRTRPADGDRGALQAFATAESAKRRLLFQLYDLGLAPGEDLAFDLLSSRAGPVVTGHQDGLITIDLAETDDVRREQRRAELDEPYRTMLGHFRHEIAHYYWPRLVPDGPVLDGARALFGDDREDYDAALSRHYEAGPPADWAQRHVSAYATMHPWEDWAETFAHYLHISDTLQTAAAFGIVVTGPQRPGDPARAAVPDHDLEGRSFRAVVAEWLPLTYALNAVNRSLGRDDLYPFTLAPTVIDKLAFVHDRVRAFARDVTAG